jgi:tight adherence protein B
MSTLIVAIAAFIGVAALIGSVALMWRGDSDPNVEDRLEMLAGVPRS